MSYKKPILNEIYIELHLEKNNFRQNDFFTIVPMLNDLGFIDIEMKSVSTFSVPQKKQSINIDPAQELDHLLIPRVMCFNEKKTQLVQLSPDLIIVNNLTEYLGWKNFKSLFQDINKLFSKTLESFKTKEISLVTTDSFTVDKNEYKLNKYLVCGGDKIPSWYKDSQEAIDIILGRYFLPTDNKNRQIKLSIRPQIDNVLINFKSVFHNVINENTNIIKILEKLHEESTNSFESIITDYTRENIMGGKV